MLEEAIAVLWDHIKARPGRLLLNEEQCQVGLLSFSWATSAHLTISLQAILATPDSPQRPLFPYNLTSEEVSLHYPIQRLLAACLCQRAKHSEAAVRLVNDNMGEQSLAPRACMCVCP